MKKIVLIVLASLSLHATSALAACKTEACKAATAWKNGYTAVILDDDISRDQYFAVLDAIRTSGGRVAIEAERVLLGWIPRAAAAKLRHTDGIAAVLYAPAGSSASLVHRPQALAALAFFDHVLTGAYEDEVEAGLAITGQPLVGCTIAHPRSGADVAPALKSTALASDSTRGHLAADYAGAPPYQNPVMAGRVTVQLFRLDSDGRTDPNLYTWTTADYNYSTNQVMGAFTYWVNEAASRNITLSFRVAIMDPLSRYTRAYAPTSTQYEPITHVYSDDYKWVNDALYWKGYAASPITPANVYLRNEDLNRDQRNDPVYGPFDASFSLYVVYNPPPAPSTFVNGFRAYTMVDGPFEMLMWNSAGWLPQNLGRVITHETGHIFWACDEYYNSADGTGCTTCASCWSTDPWYQGGPRPWASNGNCDNSVVNSCDAVRPDCIMKTNNYALCPRTPAQIGW